MFQLHPLQNGSVSHYPPPQLSYSLSLSLHFVLGTAQEQDLLGLRNGSSDNLHKHGGRVPFPELLVKFPRVSDNILVTLSTDIKIGKLKVGG
jgi:hypothetical protein